MVKLKKIAYALMLSLILPLSANADLITGSSGTIAGTSITYSWSPGVTDGGSGDLRTPVNSGSVATITFSAPVDLFLDNAQISTSFTNVNFDAVGGTTNTITNTFAADAGAWTVNRITSQAVGMTISGAGTSSILFDRTTADNGVPDHRNWGDASISGITSLTWTTPDISNYESFNFSADASAAVPEPTSFAMFGIAMLGMSRRRRLKLK